MQVEVVYATPKQQVLKSVPFLPGETVQDVLVSSGLLNLFPELQLASIVVGIFGDKVTLAHIVQAGDRIEIYRPLLIDPKVKRLSRVMRARKQR